MSTPNDLLLSQIKVPVMLTHHSRSINPDTGHLVGALSDLQATKASELITATGVSFDYRSFPDAMHAMHATDPELFTDTLTQWAATLPPA